MPTNTPQRPWREAACQGALLLALLAAAFPGTFFRGEMASSADILFQYAPWKHYAPPGWEAPENRLMLDMPMGFVPWYWVTQEALGQGEWPLWNHLEMGGVPLLANCQSTVLYPPTLLFSLFDVHLAYTLFILLKLWLCGMTAYACARTLKLGAPAARFASVAWMLGSYNLIWCYWSLPNVSIWIPVIALGTELLLEGRYRRGFFAVALGGTLSLLAGHPESVVAMNVGIAAYLLVRLGWEWRALGRRWPVLPLWGGAWLLAAAVAAPQWLPFLEFLAHGGEPGGMSNVGAKPGYPPQACVCFWVPRFFGTVGEGGFWGKFDSNRLSMIYAGIPVYFGVSLLPVRSPQARRHRSRIAALLAGVCLSVPLAFDVPPFTLLSRLPVLHEMKRHYYIGFAAFALPLLGAIGLERWFACKRRWYACLWWVMAMVAIAGVIAVVYRAHARPIHLRHLEPYLYRQIAVSVGAQLLCLAVLAASCMKPAPRLWPWALTLVLAADLLIAGYKLNPTLPRSQLYPDTKLTRFLQEQPQPSRVCTKTGLMHEGFMVPYGIEEHSGYDGLYPERVVRFRKELKKVMWAQIEPIFGVAFFLRNMDYPPLFPAEQSERFERVAEMDGIEVYANKGALPRAFLVGNARVLPSVEALFDAMRDPAFDPMQAVLLEESPEGPLPRASSKDMGAATVTHRSSTRVTIEAEATEDCVLVLSDTYYPGWKARLDGERVTVFPAYYAFRAILLPRGTHTVEFFYAPASFYLGLAISVVALSASVVTALCWLLRSRVADRRAGEE